MRGFKQFLAGPHLKALFSGVVCSGLFAVCLTLLITTAPAVFSAEKSFQEYPTHQEIMNYINQENARVAVMQAQQSELMGANLPNRTTILETKMEALMKIAWATMFGVFALLSKGLFEIYQRASMASVRAKRRSDSENDIGGPS